MLYVNFRVNKTDIGDLKILNVGIEESYANGCVETERMYKYHGKMHDEDFGGSVKHDRVKGALALVKTVISDIERNNVLSILNSIKS